MLPLRPASAPLVRRRRHKKHQRRPFPGRRFLWCLQGLSTEHRLIRPPSAACAGTRVRDRQRRSRRFVLRSIRCRPTPDLSRYEIVPIRSSSTDFALKVDGVIRGSRPDMPSLAAYVYGVLARR